MSARPRRRGSPISSLSLRIEHTFAYALNRFNRPRDDLAALNRFNGRTDPLARNRVPGRFDDPEKDTTVSNARKRPSERRYPRFGPVPHGGQVEAATRHSRAYGGGFCPALPGATFAAPEAALTAPCRHTTKRARGPVDALETVGGSRGTGAGFEGVLGAITCVWEGIACVELGDQCGGVALSAPTGLAVCLSVCLSALPAWLSGLAEPAQLCRLPVFPRNYVASQFFPATRAPSRVPPQL